MVLKALEKATKSSISTGSLEVLVDSVEHSQDCIICISALVVGELQRVLVGCHL